MEQSESFCAQCGHKVKKSPQEIKAIRARARLVGAQAGYLQAMRKGRGWILAVSILTLIGAPVYYFIHSSAVEAEIRQAEAEMADMDPETRDELMEMSIGMTWQEAVDHDRGMVRSALFTNLALAVIYFGLWLWSKKNVFAAALSALIIFITVIVVSAILDPSTIIQGILIKILVIVGLMSAVSAGIRVRKLSGKLA